MAEPLTLLVVQAAAQAEPSARVKVSVYSGVGSVTVDCVVPLTGLLRPLSLPAASLALTR